MEDELDEAIWGPAPSRWQMWRVKAKNLYWKTRYRFAVRVLGYEEAPRHSADCASFMDMGIDCNCEVSRYDPQRDNWWGKRWGRNPSDR